jgi:hypothetical protein
MSIIMQTKRRIPDFTQKAEVFGWDSPAIQRALYRRFGDEIQGQVRKAVADSSAGSGGTLIQQGVEPVIYEEFVRVFPVYDLFEKEESNGLVHAWDVQTKYSQNTADQPVTMSENAAANDDSNSYTQRTSNIGVFGTRRGASLKAMFAVRQGTAGAAFGDLSQRETDGGLMKIAHDVQAEMCRFQNTDNTSTTNTAANGLYDSNGFNGLRYHCQNLAPAGNSVQVNVAPGSGYDPAKQAVLTELGAAADAITDALGMPVDFVLTGVAGRRYLINEQLPLRRHVDKAEVRPGLTLDTVELGSGAVPIYVVPGDSIGSYIVGGKTYIDIYVGISNYLSIPWLGGPTPTVLDIPIGADGTLRKLRIPFLMVGLAIHSDVAIARVQVQIA